MEQARGDAEALIVPHQYEENSNTFSSPAASWEPRILISASGLSAALPVEPATAMWLSCCGAPSYWVGEIEQYRAVQNALHQQWEQLGKPTLVLAHETARRSSIMFFQMFNP